MSLTILAAVNQTISSSYDGLAFMRFPFSSRVLLRVIFAVQGICALFFVSDIALNVLGVRSKPISWQSHEMLEIGATFGLLLGTTLGAVAMFKTEAKSKKIEGQLRAASGAFVEHLEEKFAEWALTPAERDVAWFAVKGLSMQEIAALRKTSEGTVKAQSNAIYRKAGVSGRYQLLSLFVDELLIETALTGNGTDNSSPSS